MLTYLPPWQLWTEKASRDFIELEYPWFLKTYDRYSFPVQRVDAVRYFLLLHYGGIYIDLDNVRISDPLLCSVSGLADPLPWSDLLRCISVITRGKRCRGEA